MFLVFSHFHVTHIQTNFNLPTCRCQGFCRLLICAGQQILLSHAESVKVKSGQSILDDVDMHMH